MDKISRNKQVCIDFLTLVSKRNFAQAILLVHDDVVWWDQGNLPFSGFRYGKQAMAELYSAVEDNLIEDMVIEFGELTGEADRVAVEMASHAKLTHGRLYDNTYHFLFTVKEGLITYCKEYLDTYHTNEMLFSAPRAEQSAEVE